MKIRTIVVFSNPFGYGPTGIVTPVLRALKRRLSADRLLFAGSIFCRSLIREEGIEFVDVDERDDLAIQQLLENIENPIVVGSQNRFCILAASRLGVPSAFLDGLCWFWDDIPPEHLLADEIFWMRFPGIESRASSMGDALKKIHLVSGIVPADRLDGDAMVVPPDDVIVHLGGVTCPLIDGLPKAYLRLIGHSVARLTEIGQSRVLLVGGSESMDYIRRVVPTRAEINTLAHHALFTRTKRANRAVTTGGMSYVLEAMFARTPFALLPPINLSQHALAARLSSDGSAPYHGWSPYVATSRDLLPGTEKDTLIQYRCYAERVESDEKCRERFISDFVALCTGHLDASKQKNFLQRIGTSGAEEIADVLVSKWSLS